ncbi:histidinol-phosphate transaminase [Zhihengliuella salsuginis]|uniref:Histidinol-phosphate aminotransferase n=1 Tax=Zhihengliuella salsuginis TaxID=578222 RepID=A0ABQ3GHP2_9MICC|nr:histidinol-phosphate transaminase [Zhihengliuella salsuginis]GHD07257.1 histidinol-phosphate aminotransferase [Zhihengliuella salsuginis]
MSDVLERLSKLPLRENLRGLQPYGAPQLDVPIQLNVNENTHPLPAEVSRAIADEVFAAAQLLNRYPDREFVELRTRLAEYLGHGVNPGQVWAANGSNEVLQQILQAFGGPGRSLLSFPPTYSMYPLLASGTDTTYIAGERGAGFELTPESAAAQVREHRPNIVFLCSPNNPTGTALGQDVVTAVYEAGEDAQTVVVVDEAYSEFRHAGTPSALELLPGRSRLIVSRTMSKAFSLAGARLGYLAAAEEVTAALRLVRLPYHLSAVTQATANAALKHVGALLANVEDIKVQRDRIVDELTRMGLEPAASDSNFVFFGGLRTPSKVWSRLVEKGILVRDVGISGHLRVTAGTEAETSAFLEALEDLLVEDRAQR